MEQRARGFTISPVEHGQYGSGDSNQQPSDMFRAQLLFKSVNSVTPSHFCIYAAAWLVGCRLPLSELIYFFFPEGGGEWGHAITSPLIDRRLTE